MPRLDCLDRAEPDADLHATERVMAALDTVMDPELDESVTTMGFVESVAIDDGRAEIVFRAAHLLVLREFRPS